jgi:acetamidase/formamidase
MLATAFRSRPLNSLREPRSWSIGNNPIDVDKGLADVAPGVRVRTRPFFGQMGVAPPREWGRLDSRPPNRYGGNIDNKELVAGTRLMLPIWVDGALFSIGDGHAAQGDGA